MLLLQNIIYIISTSIIVGFTIYTILLTYKLKKKITCMNGMMISMTNAMMGSVTIGTIIGLPFQPDIATPTMISIIIGMVIGYLNGKPIALMSSLDGLMAGIMGGMMGAMLGVMLQTASAKLLITFLTIIYVIVMALLIKMINEETDGLTNKTAQRSVSITSAILTTAIIAVFAAFVMVSNNVFPDNKVAAMFIEPEHQEGDLCCPLDDNVEIVDGKQFATIKITSEGISPEEFELKSSIPTKLKFVIDGINLSDNITIESKDLKISERLVQESTIFDIGILEPGVVQFSCSTCTNSGKIVIE